MATLETNSILLIAFKDPLQQIRIWNPGNNSLPSITWTAEKKSQIFNDFKHSPQLQTLPEGHWTFYNQVCQQKNNPLQLRVGVLTLKTEFKDLTLSTGELTTMPELLKQPRLKEARKTYLMAFQLLMGAHLDSLEAYEIPQNSSIE